MTRRGGRLRAGMVMLLLVGIAALATLYTLGTRSVPAAPLARETAPVDTPARIEQGRYVATVGNCAGCHTAPGGAPYAGGKAIITSFGTLYGPNITPHPGAGIGGWDADDFYQALHDGRRPTGDFYYPAFPYTEYTRMTRQDADVLFAYLQSLAPDPTPSRPHELAFPYNQRALLPLWRGLHFRAGTLDDDPAQDRLWNRGRYLVEGPGHCAACHTPRNRLGATIAAEALGGAMVDTLQWWAPALTAHPQAGLGSWTEQDIVDLLRTGVSARGTASGPMREIVSASLSQLHEDDARAIAHYLTRLPATPAHAAGSGEPPEGATMQIGGTLYAQHCAQCHQADGTGRPPAWPPLAGNVTVTAPSPRNVILMILNGGYAAVTPANPRPHGMPPFGQVLSENDVAALATYVRNTWGNNAGAVSALAVKQAKGR